MNNTSPRFIADAMLGSLARWLRTLGFDVEYDRAISDAWLVKRAACEGRIILTRDTLLLKRRGARGRVIFIDGDAIGGQLRQVVSRFKPDPAALFSRCIRCNEPLETIPKELAAGRVPPYVLETQERFSRCARCGRVYWGGTHRQRMMDELGRMLEG